MKKSVFFVCLCFFVVAAFSQTPILPETSEYPWRILEKAKVAFEEGAYNEALRFANFAKENKKKVINWELYVINRAIAPQAVRRDGTEFSNVIKNLSERDENLAIMLINFFLEKHGEDFFEDSIENLVEWIKNSVYFPEADFLIGKIYRLEGEYDLAADFFEEARIRANLLDIPDEKFEILYTMADLELDRNNFEKYEQILLLILSEDSFYSDKNFMTALIRTIQNEKHGGFDKYFLLHRGECLKSFKSLCLLSQIKRFEGNGEEALRCAALAATSAFTHIFLALQEREMNFLYENFESFLKKASEHEDIVEWGKANEVWRMFYDFAMICTENGYTNFALEGLEAMQNSLPDKYWRAKVQSVLKNGNAGNENAG